MRFGRVEGFVEIVEGVGRDALRLRVVLETTTGLETVRDEIVPSLDDGRAPCSLSWQADQYTQETIGVHLAEQGWEVIGAGEIPESESSQIARSASYAVRLV